MNDKKIRLEIADVTHNCLRSGVCNVILREIGGERILSIAIGEMEALSIESRLRRIPTKRPLSHDIAACMAKAFGLQLKEIFIRLTDDEIFAADLVMTDGEREITIDSRSSDAMAIAIRLGAPVFTSESLMARMAAFSHSAIEVRTDENAPCGDACRIDATIDFLSADESAEHLEILADAVTVLDAPTLHRLLKAATERENYKAAAIIKREIDRLPERFGSAKDTEI